VEANRTFTGSPIFNPYAREGYPSYTQVRRNRKGEPYTPQPVIDVMKGLNELTGGDDVSPGWIGKLKMDNIDLSNPDVVNHLLSGYLSAVYNPVVKQIANFSSEKTAYEKAAGLLRPGAMYRSVDDLPAISQSKNNRYYDVSRKIIEYNGKYRHYAGEGNRSGLERHPEFEAVLDLYPPVQLIKSLESDLKHGDFSDEERSMVEMEISRLKEDVLEKYGERMNGKR
jgi:hypothetical protein